MLKRFVGFAQSKAAGDARRIFGKDRRLGIYGAEAFVRLIRYERLRADRAGRPLSVVTFTAKEGADKNGFWKRLVEELRGSARLVDHIGWVENGDVAVLLPSTPPEGAVSFAAGVSGRMSGVVYRIYSYHDAATARGENGAGFNVGDLERQFLAAVR